MTDSIPVNAVPETIHWRDPETGPRDEITVLIFAPGGSETVHVAYRSSGEWIDLVDGLPFCADAVKGWAHMPTGASPR